MGKGNRRARSGKIWRGAPYTYKRTPRQIISDTHAIQINIDGPSEGYHLEFGLYQAASGDRAFTDSCPDEVLLPRPADPEPTITDHVIPPAP